MSSINLGTFSNDHVCRNAKGVPIGRIILRDDSSYIQGMDAIPVVLLKIPLSTSDSIYGLEVYIDGLVYKIPSKSDSINVSKRDRDWVMTNFYLRRLDS